MARTAIHVHPDLDENRDWRRFVAVLCFFEFYCKFVTSGSDLWHWLHPRNLAHAQFDPTESLYFCELCAQILRAWAFYFLGRALWKNTRGAAWWTAFTIALSATAVVFCVLRACLEQDPYFRSWGLASTWAKTWGVAAQELDQIIWLTILFIVLMLRRGHLIAWLSLNGWVILAIGLCLARLAVDSCVLLPHPGPSYQMIRYTGLSEWIAGASASDLHQPGWMAPVAIALVLGLAALLFMRNRFSRWAALLVLCVDAAPIIMWAPMMPWLIHSSIQSLFNSVPISVENPYSLARLMLNPGTFNTLCVELVGMIGPWLLIAWFVRHRPMTAPAAAPRRNSVLIRSLPDDGRDAHRLCAGLLLLFAWTSLCSTVIYRVIPFFISSINPLGPEIDYLILDVSTIICLVFIAVEVRKAGWRGGILWLCALTLLLASPTLNAWHVFHDSSEYGSQLFGYDFDTEKFPIAGRIAWIIICCDWTQTFVIMALLISASWRPRPSWSLLAAAFCVGQLVDQIVSSGFTVFVPHASTASEWFSYAELSTEVFALIGLASGRFVRLTTFSVLLLCMINSVWGVVSAWTSTNTYPSHFNQLQNQWRSTLTAFAEIGFWLLITWFAWRKPNSRIDDDGSPWPRRYCAKCFYNLHGVESDRCPECGSHLGKPGEASEMELIPDRTRG